MENNLLKDIKQILINRSTNNIFKDMNDIDLLKYLNLYNSIDSILLFGKEEEFVKTFPYYKIIVTSLVDNNKIELKTNIIESYNKLMMILKRYTNDIFYLEDDRSISIRNIIISILIINILLRYDYNNSYPLEATITKDKIITKSINKEVSNVVFNLFKEIGLINEDYSINKFIKYSKIYSSKEPTIINEKIYSITLHI
mgnify:FL=1